MDADELEQIAEDVGTYYGFTDRPTCDPRVIAAAMGLTLEPWPRARARLDGSTVIYSSTARESAQAYFVGHGEARSLARGSNARAHVSASRSCFLEGHSPAMSWHR